ncbi:MAG TPA: hypothetical protein VFT65_15855 [Candidatus Angelobacter sp.]|nr:hypothetical protein [Candidatus Angelobacter sp.]
MSTCVKSLAMALVFSFACAFAATPAHSVPKDRAALTDRDWLPHVISKIAPLEWWSFASSPSDLRREDFITDFQYDQAKSDSTFPRFCFSLFRPKPQQMDSLIAAVRAYKGTVSWWIEDDCISATPAMLDLPTGSTAEDEEKRRAILEKQLHPDAEFIQQAMRDALSLAAVIEARLNLRDKPSLEFDPEWLTREGLASSRGQFEDYWEPHAWKVSLARNPQEHRGTLDPTSAHERHLAISIAIYQVDALLDELNPGWDSFEGEGPVVPAYPLLSQFSDMTANPTFAPDDVAALLNECLVAQAGVKNPAALRGLDNLIRIARWAQKLETGIYFQAENGP